MRRTLAVLAALVLVFTLALPAGAGDRSMSATDPYVGSSMRHPGRRSCRSSMSAAPLVTFCSRDCRTVSG